MTLNDLYSKTNISDITEVDYNRIPRDNDIRYYKNILFLGEPIIATIVYVLEDGKSIILFAITLTYLFQF